MGSVLGVVVYGGVRRWWPAVRRREERVSVIFEDENDMVRVRVRFNKDILHFGPST